MCLISDCYGFGCLDREKMRVEGLKLKSKSLNRLRWPLPGTMFEKQKMDNVFLVAYISQKWQLWKLFLFLLLLFFFLLLMMKKSNDWGDIKKKGSKEIDSVC